MTPKVVIVGVPGAGKSTVGKRLAKLLDVEFRDTDKDIEATSGRKISDIFVEDGEAAFRALEHDAVVAALSQCDGVVALGGGAVTSEQTREALKGHEVAWLRVTLATATSRVGLNRDRPLLLGNVRATLLNLMNARHPLYEQVSTIILDTDALSAQQAAEELAKQVAS